MMELVFWSFVVSLPPLLFSIVVRILSASADLIAWHGWRQAAPIQHAPPTFHCVARQVRRPESFGHGV